ncbi:Na+/H+ antiporter subunit E [Demequina activiva]|uniref:Sodium:proton antiporter n=1 Tax=Demequina activiva TaxID=1582364 RepID=A0A919Q3N2_9MICO|nr:Na+/H+ antiporter subunit E [Demequina activiva]GIG54989.1 sodium:proton antiporter [Demequina activiva]
MSIITWPVRLVWFAIWFATRVVISNATVVWDNLTPGQRSDPGVAILPTRCRTDAELTVLAALITLTPGTLTLGTSRAASDDSPRDLYVHGMYHPDAESLRRELRDIEGRMLHAMRRQGGPQ